MPSSRGTILLGLFLGCLTYLASATAAEPHVVFVTGDCEYRSEITMPLMARILEAKHGMRCTVCYAVNDESGKPEPKHLKNIAGLEALESADLAVLYVRFRQLPDGQLERILAYADSGKPMVGLRTTTHAFRYSDGPNTRWNDGFGRDVFGQRWITHHGHDSSTNVYVAVDGHPIVRGVDPAFHCRSWLYQVVPLHGDCTPLLVGAAVKGVKQKNETFGTPNPVAWTKTDGGKRRFFTTLGHPDDFALESMRRLVINGIYWALGREAEIPAGGANAEIQGDYQPPPTTRAVPDPTLGSDERQFAAGDEGNPKGGNPKGGNPQGAGGN